MLHAQEHTEHVGVEGGRVAVRGLFGEGAGRAFGAGVIDGNVEAAEPGDGPVDQILHVALVADGGAHEFRFCARRAKFRGQRLAGVIAAAGNDDSCAFLREGESGSAADAGQRAGDEENGITHVTSPSKTARYAFWAFPRLPIQSGYAAGFGDFACLRWRCREGWRAGERLCKIE